MLVSLAGTVVAAPSPANHETRPLTRQAAKLDDAHSDFALPRPVFLLRPTRLQHLRLPFFFRRTCACLAPYTCRISCFCVPLSPPQQSQYDSIFQVYVFSLFCRYLPSPLSLHSHPRQRHRCVRSGRTNGRWSDDPNAR